MSIDVLSRKLFWDFLRNGEMGNWSFDPCFFPGRADEEHLPENLMKQNP